MVGLSGCVPADQLAVRLIGGTLNVVLCDGPAFTQLEVAESPKDVKPYTTNDRWIASGPLTRTEDPILYGEPPEGMVTDLGPDSLTTSGNFVIVHAVVLDSEGAQVEGVYGVFDGDKISTDFWLTAAGTKADSPCG